MPLITRSLCTFDGKHARDFTHLKGRPGAENKIPGVAAKRLLAAIARYSTPRQAGNTITLPATHSHVQLVLSTAWVRHLPFEQVRDYLPAALRRRVVGSTWHRIQTDPEFSRGLPYSYWEDASRYQQVRRWVTLQRLRRWVAIDDDARGWDDADHKHLVHTQSGTGISDPAALARLAELLRP